MTFDWASVNTALITGAIFYLYRQARIVDQVRQALLGMPGQKDSGALAEIQMLRERTHDLRNSITALNGSVAELTRVMEERSKRR